MSKINQKTQEDDRLVILGSVTCFSSYFSPFDYRNPTGILLQHKGHDYLIDCGEGVRRQLDELRIDYFGIENVFISHFHPDHFALENLVQAIEVRNYYSKEKKVLNVYGPKELEARFKMIWKSKHYETDFEDNLKKFININFIELEDGQRIRANDLEVEAYAVPHGKMPALSYRFNVGKNILSYSGDTPSSAGLEKSAKDADYLLCECNQKVGSTNPGHMNPYEVGETASKCRIKNVVLTHLSGANSDEEIISDVRRSGFRRNITVSKDLMTITFK